jgi:hypothetical protein
MITQLNLARVYIESGEADSAIHVLKGLLVINQQLKSTKYADMIYYIWPQLTNEKATINRLLNIVTNL